MLRAICPVDGNVHYADDAYAGRMLRCAKCGRPVRIPAYSSESESKLIRRTDNNGIQIRQLWRQWPWQIQHLSRVKGRYSGTIVLIAALLIAGISIVALGGRSAITSNSIGRSAEIVQHPMLPVEYGSGSSTSSTPPENHFPIELHRSLKSGTRIRPDVNADGRGSLTIDNAGGGDAEVKIITDEDGRVIRDVFVQAATTIHCDNLQEGSYRIRFATGEDWDPQAKRFTRNQSFFQFGRSLTFEETRLAGRVEYSVDEITLYTLPDGNIPRQSITQQMFDAN